MYTPRLNYSKLITYITTKSSLQREFDSADSPQSKQLMVCLVIVAVCTVTCGSKTEQTSVGGGGGDENLNKAH